MQTCLKHSLYIAAIFSFGLLGSCSSDDPKRALRQSLAELVTAVENKKHRAVINKLTPNFRGNHHFDQQTMSALVFRYYLRHKFIKIYTLVNSIEIKDLKAGMVFHAVLTSTENALPEHMRAFRINSRWELKDKEWIMAEANWVEVLPRTIYPEIKPLMEKQSVQLQQD